MIVSGTHDDKEEPPQVPMITGLVPKHQKQETLSDALAGAATAFVNAFRSTPATSVPITFQPHLWGFLLARQLIYIRMKNLQQLCFLQQLMQDRIISEQEFLEQKNIILETLHNLG